MRPAVVLTVLLLATGTAGAASQRSGSLDQSFGSHGKVVSAKPSAEAGGLLVQRDGKLVVSAVTYETDADLLLVRLTRNGSPDASFGSHGIVATPIKSVVTTGFALQPDGKIVAAAATYSSSSKSQTAGTQAVVLARYEQNGTIDRSFGSGGLVRAKIAMDVAGVVLQPDGKIVVGGTSEDVSAGNVTSYIHYFRLVRYNPNGSLDTGFGKGGIRTVSVSTNDSGDDLMGALAIQKDGKLVAAGSTTSTTCPAGTKLPAPCLDFDLVVARLDADGSLDATFGHGGIVETPVDSLDTRVTSLALQPDGALDVAGDVAKPSTSLRKSVGFVLARYNEDGSIDSGFGRNGVVTTIMGVGNSYASALALQADGKLIVAGGGHGFRLARYTADGSLDSTFGSGGMVTTHVGSAYSTGVPWALSEYAAGLAVQPSGRIVAVGVSANLPNRFASHISLLGYTR
ncbi:MAG TPA: hypothetical protein VMT59_11215 [Gaiellaceae bacterium]|nr:hypothetical protein [Gaiellaceae bacterium]